MIEGTASDHGWRKIRLPDRLAGGCGSPDSSLPGKVIPGARDCCLGIGNAIASHIVSLFRGIPVCGIDH